MRSGVWKYTRHPNYFGEALLLVGHMADRCGGSVATGRCTAPVVHHRLLLRVSGVTLLEKSLKESKPGYADYVGPHQLIHALVSKTARMTARRSGASLGGTRREPDTWYFSSLADWRRVVVVHRPR